jgi:hypothetical protein
MSVIHIADTLGIDKVQRCRRCGAALKDFRHGVGAGSLVRVAWSGGNTYGFGCCVELFAGGGQAEVLRPDVRPTCLELKPFDVVVDELTYRNYRANRQQFHTIKAERWARVFDNAPALEARYQRDLEHEEIELRQRELAREGSVRGDQLTEGERSL